MLVEIKSSVFRKNKIEFHEGLNVVLGDSKASNSIGKSTALMIIDFVFGGNTYLDHNKDVVKNMGDHEFLYCFVFDNIKYKFRRSTLEPKSIFKCDDDYNVVDKINLSDFNKFLQKKYYLDFENCMFRGLVSLYSRVWGKGNYDISKPLNIVPKAKDKDMIEKFIKLFNEFNKVDKVDKKVKSYEEEQKTINKGMKLNYIPKITKTKYEKNKTEIEVLNDEIILIQKNLGQFYENPIELSNKDLLELNREKTILSNRKAKYISKLNQIEFNISKKKRVSKSKFKDLTDIFPTVNLERLEEIENFHVKVIKYLEDEIKDEKIKLQVNINILEDRIGEINNSISKILKINDTPKYIVDKVVDLTTKLNNLKQENKFYKKKEEIKNNISTEKENLEKELDRILFDIELVVNNNIKNIYEYLSIDVANAPKIKLKRNSYSFNVIDNTGTGYAYTSLIALDIAIFMSTNLPFIIHDTMLFKNIENDTMENLIDLYNTFKNKQIFIAIDESSKYSERIKSLINSKKVIELDKKNTLFKKVWNKNK